VRKYHCAIRVTFLPGANVGVGGGGATGGEGGGATGGDGGGAANDKQFACHEKYAEQQLSRDENKYVPDIQLG
jgi:hypothetical protein